VEIIFEIIFGLLQVLGELLIQIVFEGLFELGIRTVRTPFRRDRVLDPDLAGIGYVILGALAGAISLWLVPTLLISAGWLRIVNLVITPLAAGAAMGALGA